MIQLWLFKYIQLSFFPAVSWGCAEEPPTEDYEDCITEERWESIFKINVKMFIIAGFTRWLGICSVPMPLYIIYITSQGQQQHPNCVLLQHRPVQHSSIISSTDRSYSRQLAASTFLVKSRICGGSRRNENSIYFNKIDDTRCSWILDNDDRSLKS